nr:MAG TPA: hypothetical protein [Caudoviricetes sp.]
MHPNLRPSGSTTARLRHRLDICNNRQTDCHLVVLRLIPVAQRLNPPLRRVWCFEILLHIVQQICSGFILQKGCDFLRLASLSAASRRKLIKPARCLAGFFIVWQRGFIHRAVL